MAAQRIIIVHPMDPRGVKVGGIETHVRQILRRAPADIELILVGVDDAGDMPIGQLSEIEFAGRKIGFFPVAYVPADEQTETARSIFKSNTLRFMAGFLRNLFRLRRLAAEKLSTVEIERYEIVWLVRLLSRPMVLIIHNDVGDANKQDSLARHIWSIAQASEWLAYRLSDHVFTVTKRLYDRVLAMAPSAAKRTDVLTVSIDTDLFRPAPFDIADGILRIGYAGRLDAVKDPALMFSLAGALSRRLPGKFEFHYAGSSDPERFPEFEAIRQVTIRHGALRTEGMAAMLHKLHVGILTSHWEGMPCFMLESLSSGRPFAGTHLPQFEQVVLGESYGRLMERRESVEQTAEAWADGIMNLWADIRAGKIEPTRLHDAVQPFSVKRQLRRFFEVHSALADSQKPSGAMPLPTATSH